MPCVDLKVFVRIFISGCRFSETVVHAAPNLESEINTASFRKPILEMAWGERDKKFHKGGGGWGKSSEGFDMCS